jgi:hypothetical protein
MKVIGWIFVVWLIGSILYSLVFTARGLSEIQSHGDPLGMSSRWGGRMIVFQIVKGIIAFFIISLLLK